MQRLMGKALVIVMILGVHGQSLIAAPLGPSEPGPENGGLRLRLIIEHHPEKKDDSRTISLQLINVGSEPVTLVGQWEYEKPSGDYTAWLRHATEFTTFPEVISDMAGTSGDGRESQQPEQELKPGKVFTVTWREKGPVLKCPDDDLWDHLNTAPTLPSAGMYSVRAHFAALTADGKRVLLSSNEQPVIIGGKPKMPKFATTHVLDSNAPARTAEIRLGSDQGIEVGDVFQLRNPEEKGTTWLLTISQTGTWSSEGTVLLNPEDEAEDVPFPQSGWQATLVPGYTPKFGELKSAIEKAEVEQK